MKRPYDHGVFVPLKLMYPAADIAVVQLSLPISRDPALVYRMGQAVSSLRDEGVLILGSGLSFHNLSSFFSSDRSKLSRSKQFHDALKEAADEPGGLVQFPPSQILPSPGGPSDASHICFRRGTHGEL
jgi:aromatic ring-opening dioxygenase catalytic subunit (LigB family)